MNAPLSAFCPIDESPVPAILRRRRPIEGVVVPMIASAGHNVVAERRIERSDSPLVVRVEDGVELRGVGAVSLRTAEEEVFILRRLLGEATRQIEAANERAEQAAGIAAAESMRADELQAVVEESLAEIEGHESTIRDLLREKDAMHDAATCVDFLLGGELSQTTTPGSTREAIEAARYRFLESHFVSMVDVNRQARGEEGCVWKFEKVIVGSSFGDGVEQAMARASKAVPGGRAPTGLLAKYL